MVIASIVVVKTFNPMVMVSILIVFILITMVIIQIKPGIITVLVYNNI
jgi:hypothetical protein